MSKFKNTIEVIEHCGGTIGEDKTLVLEELKSVGRNNETVSAEEIETATDLARCKMYTIAFLKRADKGRYGQLSTDLENQFTRGTDQYPASITETFNLLVNHNSQRLRENETIAEERKETEMLAACQHKRSSHSCSKQMQKHLLKKSNVATASKWDIMPT